jgi:hypothetical protein
MTKQQAHSLVFRIKFASYTEAMKIVKELEIKPPVVQWDKPKTVL